jgi:hypothetical protein
VQLLRQDTEVYRYHVGAPEYLYLTIRKLKAYLKKCKITKWRDMVRNVTGQMEQYSAAALQGRAALTCGPMSITSFEPLLPHGTAASRVRVGKLIAGGKSGLLSDMAAASIASKAAASAPKDLFASSYSAIKAGQAKAARQAKLEKQKKRKGGDSDEDGGGDGSEDDEDDYGDSEGEGMSEGSDEDGEGMDYGSEGENSLGNDFDDDMDSEEEAPAPKGKGSKAQGKAPVKEAAPAPRKNKNRKHKKAAVLDYTGVDPNALADDVGELDWDNEL